MNIAFCVNTFPKFSETFILNQVTGLLDAGHDVTVFAESQPNTTQEHEIIAKYGLRDQTVYSSHPSSYLTAIGQIGRVIRRKPLLIPEVARRFKKGKTGAFEVANLKTVLYSDTRPFDAYHAHFGPVGVRWDFLGRQAFNTDAPYIVSFYGKDASHHLKENPHVYDTLINTADVVTTLSNDMRSRLINVGFSQDQIQVQPLAIDTSKFAFSPPSEPEEGDPIRLVSVARLTEKKGITYAIDAVAKLSEDYNIRYDIAGDGELRNELEEQIKGYGLRDEINLLGYQTQKEVQRLLRNSHIFLAPSVTASNGDEEGTPTVLLEAQSTGLPIVSTQHAGIPEIVVDGKSGLLVPERDAPALASAVEILIQEKNSWHEWGLHGREQVEDRHSIAAAVHRLERIYANGYKL